jgi:hypothetical protein
MKSQLACLIIGLLSAACHRNDPAGSDPGASAPGVASSTAAAHVATPAVAPTPPDVPGGIAECDALLAEMQKCIDSDRAPQALRDSYRRTRGETLAGYDRARASNPSAQAGVAQGCKAGLSAGQTAFAKYCD